MQWLITTRSDAAGAFRVTSLPRGTYTVTTPSKSEGQTGHIVRLPEDRGEVVLQPPLSSCVNCTLPPPPPLAVISAVASDAEGNPVQAANMEINVFGLGHFMTAESASGEFSGWTNCRTPAQRDYIICVDIAGVGTCSKLVHLTAQGASVTIRPGDHL